MGKLNKARFCALCGGCATKGRDPSTMPAGIYPCRCGGDVVGATAQDANGDYFGPATRCFSTRVDQRTLALVWFIGETKFALSTDSEDMSVTWRFEGQKEWAMSVFPQHFSDVLFPVLEKLFIEDLELACDND